MACTLPVPAAATLLVPAAVALLVATGAAAVDKPNGFIAEDEAGTGGALVPPDDARPKGASVGAAAAASAAFGFVLRVFTPLFASWIFRAAAPKSRVLVAGAFVPADTGGELYAIAPVFAGGLAAAVAARPPGLPADDVSDKTGARVLVRDISESNAPSENARLARGAVSGCDEPKDGAVVSCSCGE